MNVQTHHVFPYTEDTYTTHLLIDNISPVRIRRLVVIARNSCLTRIIGLPFSCVRATF